MQYDHETQQQLDLRTFRRILEDYLYCKDRNHTQVLEHSEKALLEWFSHITGLNVKVVEDKPPDS